MNKESIDCSDLAGTYSLTEIPELIKIIKSRVTEKKKEMNEVYIDFTDLKGKYKLEEIPELIKTIKDRTKEAHKNRFIYIKEARLSKRLKTVLLRENFDTLNELSLVTKKELLRLWGMGEKTFSELCEVLSENGLWYKIY
jgi:DNA-directed RNA polymerase alpha subunit